MWRHWTLLERNLPTAWVARIVFRIWQKFSLTSHCPCPEYLGKVVFLCIATQHIYLLRGIMTTLHTWLQRVSSTGCLHIASAQGHKVKWEPIWWGCQHTWQKSLFCAVLTPAARRDWSGFEGQAISPALDQGCRAGLCSPLAPLGRQEECACWPMIAVNQQLPLREMQQARCCCPHRKSCLGWASTEFCQSYYWRQKKGVILPSSGVKTERAQTVGYVSIWPWVPQLGMWVVFKKFFLCIDK